MDVRSEVSDATRGIAKLKIGTYHDETHRILLTRAGKRVAVEINRPFVAALYRK